jgi:hypothetical protein
MLLHRVEKYLRATRTPPTRFGREVLGDSRFVFNLRSGREPRASTVRKVNSYLDLNPSNILGERSDTSRTT